VVPARNIHLLPRDLPLHLGALVEPLAVALHAVRVAAPRPGTRTVVVGGGPIGQSIVLALRIEGVDQALLSEPSALRRELVESLGVRAVGPDGGPLHHQVREHFGAPADLALDAVGITPTLADALTCTRLGGTVVLVGMGSPQLTLPAFAISTEERTLTGSFTYTAEDFRDAADWLGAHPHEVAPLVSEQVPPEGAQNAFTRLSQGAPVAGKILVDFTAAADDVGSEGKAAS
jgi:threonine dehydrogenase-like Zn-dependent dehydrogenase